MTQQRFKVGDRVMTNSHAHAPDYGVVTWVYSSGNVRVDWEDGDYSAEHPMNLIQAPKKAVKMVRVGWMVVRDDGSGYKGRFYTRQIDYDILTKRRGFMLTAIYAKKGSK